jgi:Na+/proline symporter
MSSTLVFVVLAVYFACLIAISHFTSRNRKNETFFTGNRQSPWFLVAFGAIGASLSGVTFISIPGNVGKDNFYYFQIVLGYLIGYFIIANVLMPVYYRLKLISIYTYLEKRFGIFSYKTGSVFFLISRTIGSAFRMFLVAGVLQVGLFDAFHIPFEVTVLITIALIWIYTYKAGIKTIVWTDSFQTIFLVSSVIISIIIISQALDIHSLKGIIDTIRHDEHSKIFNWNWHHPKFFVKQFIAGIFIAIVMTGLDQDLMQKNLSCKNLKEAKKNMFWFTSILVPVNLLFLSVGVMLFMYANKEGIAIPEKTDYLFPTIALQHFSIFAGIVFLLGIIASNYASADSALTALTTAFCIDILRLDINESNKKVHQTKTIVHLGFSLLIFVVIVIFDHVNDKSVIDSVFTVAGYTYGPLLGLFAFGLLTKRQIRDKAAPIIAVISPVICFFLNKYSVDLFNGYKFGFELLLVNGFLVFMGLYAVSFKRQNAVNLN